MSSPKPLPPILNQGKDIALHINSFLDAKDTESFSNTCKQLQTVLYKSLAEKKECEEKASFLLPHVFNADPIKVKGFLLQQIPKFSPDKCDIVLTKASCKEEYFSPSKNKWMLKRTWKSISPLQAAAWCGDNFLVRELLSYIPKSKYKQAAAQLEGIKDLYISTENGIYTNSASFLGPLTERS